MFVSNFGHLIGSYNFKIKIKSKVENKKISLYENI